MTAPERHLPTSAPPARGDVVGGVTGEQSGTSLRRFKRYPAYKESGVPWLGEIPAHWAVAPVYARYEVALGKMLDAKRMTGDSPGCYVRNVDVQWDAVNTEGLPAMGSAPLERSGKIDVREAAAS